MFDGAGADEPPVPDGDSADDGADVLAADGDDSGPSVGADDQGSSDDQGDGAAGQGETQRAPRCRLDRRVATATILKPIALSVQGVKNETAIYLPPGLRPSATVDLIVYLHGWERSRQGGIICGRTPDVATYLRDRHFPLRERLRDSGKSAVLVVPKLGPFSQPGRLIRPGQLTVFLRAVRQALADCGAWPRVPGMGRLILAGHSGGGATVARLAMGGEMRAHLRETWMFDALYGFVDRWASFLAANPKVAARFVCTKTGGTFANHQNLAARLRRSDVEIRLSQASHCSIVRDELAGWLAKAGLPRR